MRFGRLRAAAPPVTATFDVAFHDCAGPAYGMPQPPPAWLTEFPRQLVADVIFWTRDSYGPEKWALRSARLGGLDISN
jgi:hypothetical protein